MPTYADKLRELAQLLDEDFNINVYIVLVELLKLCSQMIINTSRME